jgi:hypothetical protein
MGMPVSSVDTVTGPCNPKELGNAVLPLYECPGTVYSVRAFARKHLKLLEPHERRFLSKFFTELAGEIEVPQPLTKCLGRSEDFSIHRTPTLTARRCGARSAFLVEKRLKFKGCRPVWDGATYPSEILPFSGTRLRRIRIPFGTLSREAVMREILGYCFCLLHRITPHGTPLCVYEYEWEGRIYGYCLVMETVGETRAEEFIEYPDMTVGNLKAAIGAGEVTGCYVLGSELRLRGLNLWWYVENKGRLLVQMHTNGGFRGILNSNIGNDVIAGLGGPALSLFLCDFDTFKVVAMPRKPNARFVRSFMLHCLIEVVKGSISILDYLELPDALEPARRAEALAQVYLAKSSLWHAYRRRLAAQVRAGPWDYALLEPAFRRAIRTPVIAHVLGECVLNNHSLREAERHRGVYYPHN